MSKLEKVLLGLILTALAGLLALFIYVMIDFKNDYEAKIEEVDTTDGH